MNRSLAIGLSMLVTALAIGMILSKTREGRSARREEMGSDHPLGPELEELPPPPPVVDENRLGKVVFRSHCVRCHSNQMERDFVGPALFGVMARVPDRQWLEEYILNAPELERSGDSYAHALKNKWKSEMPPMNLTQQEVEAVILYIEEYEPGSQY